MKDITLLDGAIDAIRAGNLTDAIQHITTYKESTMRTLSIVPAMPPEKFPDLDVSGLPLITVRVIPKRGDHFYMCNPMDELVEAIESGEAFVAHTVVNQQTKRTIIEPGTIARIEEV
jgi:hypothetical protein